MKNKGGKHSVKASNANIVSKILPKYRRFDELADLMGNPNVSFCFDGRSIILTSNNSELTIFQRELVSYLKNIANINLREDGFYSKLQRDKDRLVKSYILSNPEDSSLKGKITTLNHLIKRVGGSIIASRVQQDSSIREKMVNIFGEEFIREEVAFPLEYLTALRNNIIFQSGEDGVHSELKIAQHLLRNNKLTDAEAGKFYVSSSRKCCLNCENAIKAINNVLGRSANEVNINYSSDSSISSKDFIVTRDLLTEGHGHLSVFRSGIPNFLRSPKNETEIKIMNEFLNLSGDISLEQAFDRYNLVGNSLFRDRSKSPTIKFDEAEISELLESNTKKESARDKVIPWEDSEHDVQSSLVVIPVKNENNEKVANPIIKADKETKTAKTKAKTKAETKAETKAKAKAKIIASEDEFDWNSLSITKYPVIIFYEIQSDPTAVKKIMEHFPVIKDNYSPSTFLFEDNVSQTDRLKNIDGTEYAAQAEKGRRMMPNLPEDLKFKARFAIEYLNENALLIKNLRSNGVNVFNASPPYSIVKEIDEEISPLFLQGIRNEITSLSLGRTEKELFNLPQVEELTRDLLSYNGAEKVSDHIANRIETESRSGPVVVLLEWRRAELVETKLAKLGCENVKSLFVFNPEAIKSSNKLEDKMLLNNQDFINAQNLSNTIVINIEKEPEVEVNRVYREFCQKTPTEKMVEAGAIIEIDDRMSPPIDTGKGSVEEGTSQDGSKPLYSSSFVAKITNQRALKPQGKRK